MSSATARVFTAKLRSKLSTEMGSRRSANSSTSVLRRFLPGGMNVSISECAALLIRTSTGPKARSASSNNRGIVRWIGQIALPGSRTTADDVDGAQHLVGRHRDPRVGGDAEVMKKDRR